ncbi:MAG: hypothetical protein KDB10_06430 [Acidimicrobiales bacterium]|nr:hypothetical protein [Acidimicrobiales bacterium]
MTRIPSLPHLVLATALVMAALGLALLAGNALAAVYALIAATVVGVRAVEPKRDPAPVRVEVEP